MCVQPQPSRAFLALCFLGLAGAISPQDIVDGDALTEAFPFCNYNDIVDGWIQDSRDVRGYLNYLRGPSKPSVFLEANDAMHALHRALFDALDNEDYWTAAEKAQDIGYSDSCVLRQTREGTGRVDRILLFSGEKNAKDQQIHLLWRTGPADPLFIQSPHTFKDQSNGGGGEVSTPSFVDSNARLYMRNSIASRKANEDSPCSGSYKVSDGAHYHKGWFHMAHEEYMDLHPDHGIIQFHGMNSRKDDGKTCYIHISPGFKAQVKEDSLLRYFDNSLLATFERSYADDFMASSAFSSAWTNLRTAQYHPATFNVQGRHVNASPEPCQTTASPANYGSVIQQFTHLELSGNPRSSYRDELANTIKAAGAHWKARIGQVLLIEAEKYSEKHGDVAPKSKAKGVEYLAFIHSGDWVKYSNVDFGSGGDLKTFNAQVGSKTDSSSGGIAVHIGSLGSPPVAVLSDRPIAGGWTQFGIASTTLNQAVSGVHDVYLKFEYGYNLDWFTFDV